MADMNFGGFVMIALIGFGAIIFAVGMVERWIGDYRSYRSRRSQRRGD